MEKAQKTKSVDELVGAFKKSKAVFMGDYKGLTVSQMTDFRKKLRPLNVDVRVVKNNLARLAVKNAEMGQESIDLFDKVAGPTITTFAFGDVAAVAKVMQKFVEENDAFSLKDGLLGTTRLGADQVVELSKLPSREVLLAKMLGSLNAPVSNFVGVLAAVPRSLVQVLAAIEENKRKQG